MKYARLKLCELGWPEYKIDCPLRLFNKINMIKKFVGKINQKLNIDSMALKILFVSEYNFHIYVYSSLCFRSMESKHSRTFKSYLWQSFTNSYRKKSGQIRWIN